jgi:ABC-type dipeptide/oligopeptide/nickel transport system ATPase component
MTAMAGSITLSVRGLGVQVLDNGRLKTIVEDVGFDIAAGEIVAMVGESGCGKSKTAEAIMGLLPPGHSRMHAERIVLDDIDLNGLDESRMRHIRGRDISMVFQEPMTALDPVFTCGHQLATVYRRHRGQNRQAARASALKMLNAVGFADAARILSSYPHELSGGMRQRVVVAMAMACQPKLLIADEPTTALDVTTQAQVLERLLALSRKAGTAVLLITHDLGIVAQYCERAIVMRQGRIIEDAPARTLFEAPVESYTRDLIASAKEFMA